MGARNISTKLLKSRKDRLDDSFFFIDQSMDYIRSSGMLTFTELRTIAQLKANDWKIKKGQIYEHQFNEQDGKIFSFRTLPAIGKICEKLDLYQV